MDSQVTYLQNTDGVPLLAWINFNPSMDKLSHDQ